MDPDSPPSAKTAPAAAPSQGEPIGGEATPLGALPERKPGAGAAAPLDDLPPPDAPAAPDAPRRRRRWAVLRVLLATLALGWWTQDAMRRHFDAGPYTGPLYEFFSEGPPKTHYVIDDTGRIIVPEDEYYYLWPLGGWRSAWIGQRSYRQVVLKTAWPFYELRQEYAPSQIIEGDVQGRPLDPNAKSGQVARLFGGNARTPAEVTNACRLVHYPELLELYSRTPYPGHRLSLTYCLRALRRTDGEVLLRAERGFRLSLQPPTYLMGDDRGGTIHRWDGERFVEIARFTEQLPHWVSVLNAEPLTLLTGFYPSALPATPKSAPKPLETIYRVEGSEVLNMGRYTAVSQLAGPFPPVTDQKDGLFGDAIPDPAMDYLIASRDPSPGYPFGSSMALSFGRRGILLDRQGRELIPGRNVMLFKYDAHFLTAIKTKDEGDADGEGDADQERSCLVVRATGTVHFGRRVSLTKSPGLAIIERANGTCRVFDAQGRALGDPAWQYICDSPLSPGDLIVQLDGKRGVWRPGTGYLIEPRYTFVEALSPGIYAVSEEGSLHYRPIDFWGNVAKDPWSTSALGESSISTAGVLDTQGRWRLPIALGELSRVIGGDDGSPWYVRRSPGVLRIYDEAWQLRIERSGAWRHEVFRVAQDLLVVFPGPVVVHNDGSPGPDFGGRSLRWLDGERLIAVESERLVSLWSAAGEPLLDGTQFTDIRLRAGSPVIDLHLPPQPDLREDRATKVHRFYDPRSGALSPRLMCYQDPTDVAGRPKVLLADTRVNDRYLNVLLGEDLQPLQPFLDLQILMMLPFANGIETVAENGDPGLPDLPGVGAWRSASRLLFAKDATDQWHLLDLDGHPITPVVGRFPNVVDPRFLSLRTPTGMVLIDRFGRTVTPRPE